MYTLMSPMLLNDYVTRAPCPTTSPPSAQLSLKSLSLPMSMSSLLPKSFRPSTKPHILPHPFTIRDRDRASAYGGAVWHPLPAQHRSDRLPDRPRDRSFISSDEAAPASRRMTRRGTHDVAADAEAGRILADCGEMTVHRGRVKDAIRLL